MRLVLASARISSNYAVNSASLKMICMSGWALVILILRRLEFAQP